MKRRITYLLSALILLAIGTSAASGKESMAKQGKSVAELVPSGWEGVQSAEADFDKDGIADLVIVAMPNYEEHIYVREDDGYAKNLNAPVITFYRGNADGIFTQWQQSNHIIPAQDEFMTVEYGMQVNENGVVTLSWNLFFSAGGSDNIDIKKVFRYQNGDFYLIGEEEVSQNRMSGEVMEVSCNYLTNKKQTVTSNCFDDSVKKKERWQSIKKAPLKRFTDIVEE